MDFGGKSDPYCIVTVGDEEDKTSIKYNTVNPKWGESFTFSIYNGPHFRSRSKYTFGIFRINLMDTLKKNFPVMQDTQKKKKRKPKLNG